MMQREGWLIIKCSISTML